MVREGEGVGLGVGDRLGEAAGWLGVRWAAVMDRVEPSGNNSTRERGTATGVTPPYPRADFVSPVRLSSAYRMPCAVTRYTVPEGMLVPGAGTGCTTAPCPATVMKLAVWIPRLVCEGAASASTGTSWSGTWLYSRTLLWVPPPAVLAYEVQTAAWLFTCWTNFGMAFG